MRIALTPSWLVFSTAFFRQVYAHQVFPGKALFDQMPGDGAKATPDLNDPATLW